MIPKVQLKRSSMSLLAALILFLPAIAAQSQNDSGLVQALQRGGLLLVMRHASSPQTPPKPATADPANKAVERQLDETGIESARAMGKALDRLHIPIGPVYSSPTFRAMQTVKCAHLGTAISTSELGDHGMSMSSSDSLQAKWLQDRVSRFVPDKDVFIVTHMPNIKAAFPSNSDGLGDGEALVFGPDGHGGSKFIARIKSSDWPAMKG